MSGHLGGRVMAQAIAGLALAVMPAAAAPALGPPQPFARALVVAEAERLAGAPHQPREVPHQAALQALDYDGFRKIRYRDHHTAWLGAAASVGVQPFHPGRHFEAPVRIYLVEDGAARELLFDPALFDHAPEVAFAAALEPAPGFAGFRVIGPERREWLAFLGASYFRSPGELGQYGLSARGVALDSGGDGPEEFPAFTAFWLEPAAEPHRLIVHALLDGPSLTGAFRFDIRDAGAVVMEVEAELFARTELQRLGVAPLTSMYWYSITNTRIAEDWRPQVHDSDGLAIVTADGRALWRPLDNPPALTITSYATDGPPRGFGLLQRDREFRNHDDPGPAYERRPSLWVEPLGAWPEGAVELVEIPTKNEYMDNIVAFWRPAEALQAGERLALRYRLHWVAEPPLAPELGRVVATRLMRSLAHGRPAQPGEARYVVDFDRPLLRRLAADAPVRAVASASRGRLTSDVVKIEQTGLWRAFLELEFADDAPVELALHLEIDGRPLTETWLRLHHELPEFASDEIAAAGSGTDG